MASVKKEKHLLKLLDMEFESYKTLVAGDTVKTLEHLEHEQNLLNEILKDLERLLKNEQ